MGGIGHQKGPAATKHHNTLHKSIYYIRGLVKKDKFLNFSMKTCCGYLLEAPW